MNDRDQVGLDDTVTYTGYPDGLTMRERDDGSADLKYVAWTETGPDSMEILIAIEPQYVSASIP